MRTKTSLFYIVFLAYVVTRATCLTNAGFYEMVKDYVTDVEIIEPNEDSASFDDVDDDVLELPGGADDNLDIEFLMERLGEQNDADYYTAVEEQDQESLKRGSCRCRRHYCKCCLSKTFKVKVWRRRLKFKLRACLKVAYRRRGFEITFTINGHRLCHKRYSLKRGVSLCYRVPQFPAAKICLDIYNINLRRKRACARLTGKVKLGKKRFRVHLKLGCFRLPILDEGNMESPVGSSEYPSLYEEDLDILTDDSQQEMTYLDDVMDDPDSNDDLDLEDASQDVWEMQTNEDDSFEGIEQDSKQLNDIESNSFESADHHEIEEDDAE
ncbi:uncharacterized protein LOC123542119 [Mercenaria mercenaria]|uniref:uncharacterized protein LOC123542119 n=1 Tax=Mercenaria mercenaria TaxID=6596 RepID=UPI00234E6A82|nr:uncharacterized protein LOC123542119 [Mercenaria mercenaria]